VGRDGRTPAREKQIAMSSPLAAAVRQPQHEKTRRRRQGEKRSTNDARTADISSEQKKKGSFVLKRNPNSS